jgi:hypothetical protein
MDLHHLQILDDKIALNNICMNLKNKNVNIRIKSKITAI